MKGKLFFILTLVLGGVILFGGLTWLNMQLIENIDTGEHFLVSWTRARAFLLEGKNPYGEVVTQDVQVQVYGRYAQGDEYTYQMGMPFYKLFVYFPFALINDYELSFAIWLVFAEIALLGVGLLSVHLSGWKPSVLHNALFNLSVLFSFLGVFSIVGGSGAVFIALSLLIALILFRDEDDGLLGLLLLAGTFNPAQGGAFFVLLILSLLYKQRWQAFRVALMGVITLFIVSSLILPDWLSSYYEVLVAGLVGYGVTLSDFLMLWIPEYSNIIADLVRWLVVAVLIIEWATNLRRGFSHLLWVAALVIISVPFLNISFSPYFLTLFFFPLPLVFKNIQERWPKASNWLIILFLLLLLSTQIIVQADQNTMQILIFAYSLVVLVGLYWVRWWSLRLPHTWVDDINRHRY